APMVSAAKGKKGKWGNPQYALKDKEVIDNGCSQHMTGNMSYLSDFEKLNGGYVAFGGNPKGGKISGKGKIKTCKLDFEDVYLLPDKSQVLLRVPRENNMYNVNLKNIVPSGDLTCLFVKETIDESNLWHRKLGHINFKTINKLVKGNLVRGLPIKVFENNNTCVACKEGKQHRASCKTKPAEAINTACYVQNRVLVTKPHNKTPYELLHGRTLSIGFIRPFGCPVTILNTLDPLGKFEGKVDEGFMVGYSLNSKAFRVFNSRTRIVQETLHVNFLENKPNIAEKAREEVTQQYMLFPMWSSGFTNPQNKDGDVAFDGKEHKVDTKKPESAVNVSSSISAKSGKQDDKTKKKAKGQSSVESFTKNKDLITKFKDHSDNSSNDVNVVGSIVSTAGQNSSNRNNPFSAAGPSNTTASLTHGKSSLKDASQLLDIHDMLEMEDITYSDHENVSAEADFNNLETSITVYRNKKDEKGIVVRNKARLVSQGHTQEEGIDYEEVFAPVARIEAIRLFLAYASFMGFMVYQIDVKSAFLYGTIKEEVYVCQPSWFEDPNHPEKVYKVVKALYGLHQAPRAWYETLANYLLENGFHKGKIDQTLFIKKEKGDILLVQIYVDDIIFGATNKDLCKSFEKLMKDKFQMSSIRELTFFLGLQVKQKKDRIFISQDKYVPEILKKFGLTKGKSASTPIDTEKPLLKDPDGEDVDVHIYRSMIGSLMYLILSRPDIMFEVCACACFQVTPKASHFQAVKRIFRYLKGKPHLSLWYPKYSPFDLVAYSDSDYAGKSLDRKSTTRGCQFLGCRLISWQCKKHIVVATSSTKAEYVAAASCCAQSEASKGFEQIIDFLNGSYIKYAITVNPHIYVSCIKQFWNTVTVKQSNDVTRLQALVDRKKVVISEAVIRDALRLADAKVVDCLSNEEIFTGLARKGYEKPSTKLTFYKAFFSSQWKLLIHIILQSMSAKRTSWNEFSSAMASAVICLSTGRKFNFSKYIFESLVRNVDSSSKFYMYPRFIQLIIQNQLEKEVQGNDNDVAQGADTAVLGDDEALDACAALTRRVEHLEHDKVAQDLEVIKLKTKVKKLEKANKVKALKLRRLRKVRTSERVESSADTDMEDASNQGRMIAELDRDTNVALMDDKGTEKKDEDAQVVGDEQVKGRQAKIYQIDIDHAAKVLSMQQDEPEVQEVVEVVTTAKLITEVVTTATTPVSAASIIILAAEPKVPTATINVAPVRVASASTRRRKGVVIKDPKEESTAKTPVETKSKDKGKGIMVKDPKPMKKKQQVEMDEE
nr:putative ribonuclease H-like domain-containing protein [Tanacetum cinerariifolium]